MTGETLDYNKHLTLQFGQYCQVHEEENPTNSQVARTKGAISLRPSGNLQGGYRFMDLNTGKKIKRRSWDAIPMPNIVIACVNTLGSDQPKLLTFTDQHGGLIGDNELPEVDIAPNEVTPFPGVDNVIDDQLEIPGVDGVVVKQNEAPQIAEIDDLDLIAADPEPTTEETAPPADPIIVEQTLWQTMVQKRKNRTSFIPSIEDRCARVRNRNVTNQALKARPTHIRWRKWKMKVYTIRMHTSQRWRTFIKFAAVMVQLSLKAGLKQ